MNSIEKNDSLELSDGESYFVLSKLIAENGTAFLLLINSNESTEMIIAKETQTIDGDFRLSVIEDLNQLKVLSDHFAKDLEPEFQEILKKLTNGN